MCLQGIWIEGWTHRQGDSNISPPNFVCRVSKPRPTIYAPWLDIIG